MPKRSGAAKQISGSNRKIIFLVPQSLVQHSLTVAEHFPIVMSQHSEIIRGFMTRQNIILTGFMGTGKSTIGRLLAKEIGYTFIDTDHVIEERVGKSIPQIFAEDGEEEFRRLEAELVQELADQQGLVIATGGGLVMNPENVVALEKTGKIFCLTATPEEILERVSRQPGSRPLLSERNPLLKITQLLSEREPTYKKFQQITSSRACLNEIVKKLQRSLIPN